jgi:hypothetical protein
MGMGLTDPRLDKLISIAKDSFRVRENHDPDYVDLGGHLDRIWAGQHQIVFGRRGSGKSCLLVFGHRHAKRGKVISVYLSADEIKTLKFPDILIRLLLTLYKRLGKAAFQLWKPWRWGTRLALRRVCQDLKVQLDSAERASVVQESKTSTKARLSDGKEGSGLERTYDDSTKAAFSSQKIDHLERHLQDYKEALRRACAKVSKQRNRILLMIDDFYALHLTIQPDVIDYLHRLVRGLDVYLKIGTIRHRTSLVRQQGQTIGVELSGDVEQIDLDHTLEDVARTQGFLKQMLDALGKKVGIESASTEFFNATALHDLTLASGGVPRDFLTIFVEAVSVARGQGDDKWLTARHVYKAGGRVNYRTKLQNIKEVLDSDANPLARVFVDLLAFCLQESKKTLFLIAQEDAQRHPQLHELVKQLMDFRLVHIVEPDTSAASGRTGRYEAYTLDFSSFMEPRRRGIEVVEFWKIDGQRRRVGLREASVYPLDRIQALLKTRDDAEERLKEIETATEEPAPETYGNRTPGQAPDEDLFSSLNRDKQGTQ